MPTETSPAPDTTASYAPRGLQIVSAMPSMLIWLGLVSIALVWYTGVAIQAISGTLHTGDGRFAYLCFMLFLVLLCACQALRTFRRAVAGRSPLWWHGATLGLGILLLGLIGIVGD